MTVVTAVHSKKNKLSNTIIKALEDVAPGCIKTDVSLADISWYKIGGIADAIVEPDSLETAIAIVKCLKDHDVLYTTIGSTSNILFDDGGYRGVLIKISSTAFNEIEFGDDGFVKAGAGVWIPYFVRNLINRGLIGCTHAIGIPGALGGMLIMNGGSLRKGIGEQVIDVTIIDDKGYVKTLSKEECKFGYRSSSLQKMNCLVIGATFKYEQGTTYDLRKEALELLVSRSKKFPRRYPNCGSVFLSYPEMYSIVGPPGKAIEDLGFKGKVQGGAMISSVHANFIVNTGGASSNDILNLIHQCRDAIRSNSGFEMNCEVRFLPSNGQLEPAHIQADRLFAN